jgi:peptide/nickel transport system permease protein
MPTLLFMLAFALLVKGDYLAPPLRSAFAGLGFLLHAEPGMVAIYLAIGLTAWVSLCRVIRAETMKLKNSQYILAAKVAGQHPWVILFRHLLPNVFHLVIIYFTLIFASAVMTEVIASYLGVGVQTSPSWGVMISDGQDRLWRGVWWEVAAATGFMFFLVLSLNILSDHLRDKLDPRSR